MQVVPCEGENDVAERCLLMERKFLGSAMADFMCLAHQLSVRKRIKNRLTPNDPYMGRTAPLTSKRCILYIYSTNVVTEYFKHALYSPFFLFKMQFVS